MYLIIALFSFIIYRNWFLNPQIIGGDWPFYFSEMLEKFTFPKQFWGFNNGNGMGGPVLAYGLDSYLHLIVSIFVNKLNLPWEVISKVFFFGFFIISSIYSISALLKNLISKISGMQLIIGNVIFLTNTYVLLIAAGGQLGIGLSYAFFPLALSRFLIFVNSESNKFYNSILSSLAFSAVVIFDQRVGLLLLIVLFLYFLIFIIKEWKKYDLVKEFPFYSLLLLEILLLNSLWILPLLSTSNMSLEVKLITNSLSQLKFFSFADISHAISLLHPNWPENIFGKVSFLKFEFLIIPLISFSSLFFVESIRNIKERLNINFFIFISLIGIFLAKGANDPFPYINIWLFENIPGFSLFRDPTKFYILICVSYSLLIPFALGKLSKLTGKRNVLYIMFFIFWLFTIRQAIFSNLNGTFSKNIVPQEYIKLKDYLKNDNQFYRTLWVPRQQRFTFFEEIHPSVEARSLFKSSEDILLNFRKGSTQEVLSNIAVRYVIVPYDSLGEIFLDDRKYDPTQYKEIVDGLKSISWLDRKNEFKKLAVFENKNYKDHFWSPNDLGISYITINPTKYRLTIKNAEKGDEIVFSENYNYSWKMKDNSSLISSKPSSENLNSFILNRGGNYDVEIFFSPQRTANLGTLISIFSLLVFLFTIFYINHKNKS